MLSYAHLDRSGWLPRLVRNGFAGPIHASPATCALAAVLLLDSAHLQEEDARRANRYGSSRHAKALPLYTRADAQRAIPQFVPLPPGREARIGQSTVSLSPVGHLLGACAVRLEHLGTRLVFSGDLGRSNDLLMPPPEPVTEADVLVVESTYGNREHPAEDSAMRLADIINRTVRRGGCVVMPAFAVGRAQALMLMLRRLKRAGAIPTDLPVFLDSPMAAEATAPYSKFERVLQHLKTRAPDSRNAIVLAGFQVGGSRGARLVAGEREIKIFGEWVPVRAEVDQLAGFSAHADRSELIAWMRQIKAPPRQTWVVHGEPDAADALRVAIQRELGWSVHVPQFGQSVVADAAP